MSTDRGVPFGDYALVRRLARGGMAEVFLARQKALDGWGRQVAIKRILPHLADAPALIRMFVDEARVAATLAHSNIVHIYDVGKVGDDFYIAMEFVDGIHAGQLILHRDRLPPTLIARIGADAAAALAYAHDHKDERGRPQPVVHRDVSPHNLMVSWGGAVKLVDFGIAKALGGDETRPGVVKGKYAYMSPEQAVGRAVGGASDVFSLGLVLWELCAGRHAFERGDPAAVMRLIRDGRVPSLTQAAPGIPMPLAEAIGWALQREPGQRATAAELGAALEGFIKASPELATPRELAAWLEPRFPRTGPTVGEHTGVATIGTVVATGTSAALGTSVGATAIGTAVGAPAVPGRARTSTAPPPRPRTVTAPPRPRTATAPRPALPPPVPTIAPRPAGARRPRAASDVSTGDHTIVDMVEPVGDMVDPGLIAPTLDSAQTIVRTAAPPRRRLWLLAPLAIVALASVVILVILATRGDTPAPPAPIAAIAPPDAPLPDAAPAPDAPPPPPDAAPPRDAPAPASAHIDIVTTPPGATVIVGDNQVRSPVRIGVAPGRVTLRVELDGYQPLTRALQVEPGEHVTLELTLNRRAASPARVGYFTVRTAPYADVYLGARHLGQTPFADLPLPAGTHRLVFRHPAHRPVTRAVTIRAGETTRLRFDLP